MKYHVVNGNRIVHSSSRRGCMTVVTRRGYGRVITDDDAAIMMERDKLAKRLAELDAASAAERDALGYAPKAVGPAPEFWKHPPHGSHVVACGELGRCLIALAKLESRSQSWCGTWDGGSHAWTEHGEYRGHLMYDSAEEYLARLAKYARETYAHQRRRGDRLGMLVAAQLLAATANVDEFTYIRGQ